MNCGRQHFWDTLDYKVKKTILVSSQDGKNDKEDNAQAHAELIQFLDNKSLLLVMREATDDGSGALMMLRHNYANKINLELSVFVLN